jgi:N-acetylneuraminic acid mutarotase
MTKRLFLSLTLVSSLHAADWEPLPPLPEPNGGFVCGNQGEFIVVIGGTNWEGGQKYWLNSIRHFDAHSLKWRPEFDAKLPGGPLAYGVLSQVSEISVHVLGGTDGKKSRPERLLIDSIKTSHGAPIRDLSKAVVLSAGGFVSGKPLIVGGSPDPADLEHLSKSTYEIVNIEKPWPDRHLKAVRMADYPGKPFATAASAALGDELFVFGGMNYDAAAKLPVNTDVAYAFSPSKNAWRTLKPLEKAKRGLTAVALDEKHIYIAGGYADDFTAEAVIYDLTTDSYRAAKSLPYAAMVGLVKLGEFVYCLGGEDKMKHRTDKFFRIPVAELLK